MKFTLLYFKSPYLVEPIQRVVPSQVTLMAFSRRFVTICASTPFSVASCSSETGSCLARDQFQLKKSHHTVFDFLNPRKKVVPTLISF